MPPDPAELWGAIEAFHEDGTANADCMALVTGVLDAVLSDKTDAARAALHPILDDQDVLVRLLAALMSVAGLAAGMAIVISKVDDCDVYEVVAELAIRRLTDG